MERLKNGKFAKKTGLYYEPHYHTLCQKLCDMKRRCNCPKDPSFPLYGGRGIAVCEEWSGTDGHKNFYFWAIENGYKKGLSIERIDNDGPYSPENCKWANWKEQGNNRRTCHYIKIGKVEKSVTQWAELFGISPDTALGRYAKGLPLEMIFYDGRLPK